MSEEVQAPSEAKSIATPVRKEQSSRPPRGKGGGRGRGPRKEPKEFDEEVLDIARVTRVVKGGRRMRFLATVAIGNKKGKVGLGTGKSVEVSVAIRKAVQEAKKHLITVPLKDGTILFNKEVKYKGARLRIMPASTGTGVIAGGSFRKIAVLAGIKDIYAKSIGSNSPLASAQASIKALSSFVRLRKSAEEA